MARGRGRAKVKPVVSELDTIANDIGLPRTAAARAHLILVDVANRTDEDQRRTVRSGKPKTVKRVHMLDRWHNAKVISDGQKAAGDAWGELRHAGRYDAVKVANYDPPSSGSADPLAKVLPFAVKTQTARFQMRDIIKQLHPADIARLDAVAGPSPIRLAGRGGQVEFIAIKLALTRLALVLKIAP